MGKSIDTQRSEHRQKRRQHSEELLAANSEKLANNVMELEEYKSAVHVAAYIAILGEISVEPIISQGCVDGKTFYLPVLRDESMFFAPWQPGDVLLKKGFGLLEPDCSESNWIKPQQLDLVLTPLVVFDKKCNRIGQGGGFYDRTFEFTRHTQTPQLIGVAHDNQREPALDPQPWDIPLDAIVTEITVYRHTGICLLYTSDAADE